MTHMRVCSSSVLQQKSNDLVQVYFRFKCAFTVTNLSVSVDM